MADKERQLLVRVDDETKMELKRRLLERRQSVQGFFEEALAKILGIGPGVQHLDNKEKQNHD